MPSVTDSGKPFTGLTASIKIGTSSAETELGYASGADLTLEKDIIEILSFGKTFKEKVPAIHDWSLSIDGTVALAEGSSQKQLYDAFNGDTLITVGLYLDKTTYFEGKGYVQSFNMSMAPDDKINLTAEIAGSGATELHIGAGMGA